MADPSPRLHLLIVGIAALLLGAGMLGRALLPPGVYGETEAIVFPVPFIVSAALLLALGAWLVAASGLVGLAPAPTLAALRRWWELPFIGALASFMFWVRMLPYQALVGSGRAYYIGTDPFFHYRETLGAVRAFPGVPRWDPWTFFPHGTATNQFGSLFNWICAAFIVATEGKGASEAYVQKVLGIYPAVLGALLVVPFFYLAKRMMGTSAAVVGSIVIALLPGEFLIRSIAGYSDHHVAEALFMIVSVLGVYVAATRMHAARAALLEWREVRGYWKALAFAVLGGMALAANFYAWPPALLFLVILTLWLTVVIVLEAEREGGDARGYAWGGAISFAIAGIMMIPVMETTELGDFNAYGLLQVVAPIAAAAWLVGLDAALRYARAHRVGGLFWGAVALVGALIVGGVTYVYTSASGIAASLRWGLSWVTGISTPRTTLTIAEARGAAFFCEGDTGTASCLQQDFGLIAPVSAFILFAVVGWAIWKRRPSDVLLAIWCLVIFRATDTQIRFSYYLAVSMALLLGWLAARIAEGTGLERTDAEKAEVAETAARAKTRGRKTKTVADATARGQPMRIAAVTAVLLLLLPGNVFATDTSRPGWEQARIGGADGDLVLWMDGLDWMRVHTPDAGVDLAAIVERPAPGELYDYPPQAYGVLSWWDYGHWTEAIAVRPPVANPFQQAAPFASLWFTERDTAVAEQKLECWQRGFETLASCDMSKPSKGPVRYVWIDDAMATGKYGAITVWANGQNASRARWADGDYIGTRDYRLTDSDETVTLPTLGPEYRESMMGRLYDFDAAGMPNYRLVWEHSGYNAMGQVATPERQLRCLHDTIPSRGCPVNIPTDEVLGYTPGTALRLGSGEYAYDLNVGSRLKLFERVEGARLVGTTEPGATVTARVHVDVRHPNGSGRDWEHRVTTTAGSDGQFVLVFPYSTADQLPTAQGGTDLYVRASSPVLVDAAGRLVEVQVPDAAVLRGEDVAVAFP